MSREGVFYVSCKFIRKSMHAIRPISTLSTRVITMFEILWFVRPLSSFLSGGIRISGVLRCTKICCGR